MIKLKGNNAYFLPNVHKNNLSTFPLNKITPLIESGHIHFGENKIQEAESKWVNMKKQFVNLKLHMIGRLQSNKVSKAIKIFDYIHSLENEKLALKIFKYEKELNKKIRLFIQVNLAEENEKSGILLRDLNKFYDYCTKELSLNVIGLMSLPPMARWEYGYEAPPNSRESLLTDLFTKPQDWFDDETLEEKCRPHKAID